MRAVTNFLLLVLTSVMLVAGCNFSSDHFATGWTPSQLLSPSDDLPGIWGWDDAALLLSDKLRWTPPSFVEGPEDSVYILPTQEDIDDLLKFFWYRRQGFPWTTDSFDCDDFATEAKYLATVWSYRRFDRTHAGLLVGKAYVHLDGNYALLFPGVGNSWVEGYHVLNFIVRADGQVFFWEPQTNLIAPAESFIYEGSIEVFRLEY